MLTVFCVFVLIMNRLKRHVRTLNTLCSLYGWVEAASPVPALKYASRSRINRPRPFLPSLVATTVVNQWRIMAYTTPLKSVGDRGILVSLYDKI